MRYVHAPVLLTLYLLLMSVARAERPAVLPCHPSDITLRTDDSGGLYDGKMQDGTTLVLRNAGAGACMLPPLPELHFSDAGLKPVIAERRMVRGLHPGPVLLPVTMATGAELQIRLRWVARDDFAGGNCIRPAFVSLDLDGGALTVPFDHQMCAAKGQTGYYSQLLTVVP